MLSNYYTLVAVAKDLGQKLCGYSLREAYSQQKNELVLSFEGVSGGLIISCTREINSLFWHPSFSRARTNSVDVLKGAVGMSVRSVDIQRSDRVIGFAFDDGSVLHAQFFGSKANVLFTDAERRIVDAFKDARTLVGAPQTPRDGELVLDVTVLRSLIADEADATVFNILRKGLPVLGATLATEVLFRSGIALGTPARDLKPRQIAVLEDSVTRMLVELARPQPRVYLDKDEPYLPYRFAIVRLEHCAEFEEKLFDDIHEGIRYFVSTMRASRAVTSDAEKIRASLVQQRTKLERTSSAIEEDLRATSRADEYERYATTIMANLDTLRKGMKEIPLQGQGTIVPLDAKLTPVQNAQRYYAKAKKSRAAYEQARERLDELKASHNLVERLLAALEVTHTKDELRRFMTDHEEDLRRFGIGRKAEERQQLPFRIFIVDGGFEVWAGKSSRNNDELTLKYAKPGDLWFHARGASGSHVILKNNSGKGEPGKKAKEQAAGIAAYYSKMKNASMVPVAMTERKYVRKPKGAPPGTVTLEREKVIFAEPALPKN